MLEEKDSGQESDVCEVKATLLPTGLDHDMESQFPLLQNGDSTTSLAGCGEE